VRETLFNWLGQDLSGWRALDAFAGSGALGFEAASRGAAEVLLLERDAQLVAGLNATRQRLGAATLRIERADAMAWLRGAPSPRFEAVFLDPPFDAGLGAAALKAAQPWLVDGGYAYLEGPVPLAEPPEGLLLHRQARAGKVHFQLFRRSYTAAVAPPRIES
jgi:16S rRNA (guanine(966)-N(2))-methyltransferase RsmD